MNPLDTTYEWRPIDDAPLIPTDFDPEPFATWKRLKAGSASRARFLVELPKDSSDEVATLGRLGLETVPIYPGSGRKFWTVHTAGASAGARAAPKGQADAPYPAWLSRMRIAAGDDITSRHRLPSAADRAATSSKSARRSRGSEFLPVRKPDGPVTPPVIAVIDTTCAFLHSAFRKPGQPGKTRILALWDQDEGRTAAAPWKDVRGFGYGRELRKADIDQLIQKADNGGSQRAVYREVGQDMPDVSDRWSHGTQVLAIAGAVKDPFVPGGEADAASRLDLIAVQLPLGAVGHTHGIWLNTYVLDGIHYALRRAPPNSPVIVNVSMGGSLGPHDGTSLLERAVDDLVGAWGGRLTVVLAAGNARLGEMHTESPVEPGAPAVMTLLTNPQDGTPNFMDMWLTPAKDSKVQMRVAVKNGNGPLARETTVLPGQSWGLFKTGAPDGTPPVALACMSRRGKAVNGRRLQAFVGIEASRKSAATGSTAPVGRWTVSLESTTKGTSARVWLGRDDIPAGFPGEQDQLQFAQSPRLKESGTLSSLAGGRSTIVVGAYRINANGSAEMFEESGEGKSEGEGGRRFRPDVCGATSTARTEGAPEVSFYSDPPERTNEGDRRKGTSMAAPFVARRLANLIATRKEAWPQRGALLKKLELGSTDLKVTPSGRIGWTGRFWAKP
jgi:hypothetical protein